MKEVIFHREITDKAYEGCMYYLTLADELVEPLLLSEARLLFFVLQVNRQYFLKESETIIKTVGQATVCYELCGGDYKELNYSDPEDNNIKHMKFNARHTCLFPDCSFSWSIPVKFFSNAQKQKMVTIVGSSEPYALLSIDSLDLKNIKIPRSLYMRFFAKNGNGRLIESLTDSIRLLFDETDKQTVEEVIEFIGLTRRYKILKSSNTEYYYDKDYKALVAYLLTANSDICQFENDEERVLWKQLAFNKFRFLNTGAEYLPFLASEEMIFIYLQ